MHYSSATPRAFQHVTTHTASDNILQHYSIAIITALEHRCALQHCHNALEGLPACCYTYRVRQLHDSVAIAARHPDRACMQNRRTWQSCENIHLFFFSRRRKRKKRKRRSARTCGEEGGRRANKRTHTNTYDRTNTRTSASASTHT
jgi:hypothetical protein